MEFNADDQAPPASIAASAPPLTCSTAASSDFAGFAPTESPLPLSPSRDAGLGNAPHGDEAGRRSPEPNYTSAAALKGLASSAATTAAAAAQQAAAAAAEQVR